MARRTLVSRLLEAAEVLLREKPRSSAFRRRAVSTAYYAVFHALAKECTTVLLPTARRADVEYIRIYRALEHGFIRSAFDRPPLRDHEELRKIGLIAGRLQIERNNADYLPPSPELFPVDQVEELIKQALETVDAIQALSESDKRYLAAFLLFKERKS